MLTSEIPQSRFLSEFPRYTWTTTSQISWCTDNGSVNAAPGKKLLEMQLEASSERDGHKLRGGRCESTVQQDEKISSVLKGEESSERNFEYMTGSKRHRSYDL
jgi:hypothetical protein